MDTFIQRRWVFCILLLLVVGVVSVGVRTSAVPDNSLRIWFLDDDPKLKSYDEFHRLFGNDEVILLMVQAPSGVLDAEVLQRLARVSADLEKLPGVERVHSVLSTRDLFDSPEGIRFDDAVPDPVPSDPAEADALKRRLMGNSLFADRLINADGTVTMLWIQMAVMEDFDNRRDAIVASVSEVIDAGLGDMTTARGGVGVIYSALNLITQRDFGVFVTLSYLLMFVVLWWVFRSWRLVAGAMGVITVGTVTTLGVYGLMGHRLNLVTVLLPTLVIVLGLADAIHFPSALLAEAKTTGDRTAAARNGLGKVLLPCTMTTATTMAGFLALTSSPIAVIRDLGIYAALGIGVSLVASMVLMTVAFLSIPASTELPRTDRIRRLLAATRATLEHRPRTWAAIFALATVAALFGATKVTVDTYTLGYLPDDHEAVQDHRFIAETWGDYFPVEFLVRPRGGREVTSPDVLNAMESFVDEASRLPEIRNGLSAASVYRRMEQVMAPDLPPQRPMSPELVAQLGLLLEGADLEWEPPSPDYRDNVLAPLMLEDGSVGRVTLVGRLMSAGAIGEVLARLEAIAQRTFGDVATVECTGYTPLYVEIIDHIMASQKRGFGIALAIIFGLMLVWLRSLRLALIAVAVNVFPVLVMLSTMAALRVDLDIAGATIGAIVLGVSIDDTVHFLHHWKRVEARGGSWSSALEQTFQAAGVPAVITTIVLVVGYPVLMLAEVKTVFYFGLLTSVAAATALAADLIMLPLLLKAFPARRSP